MYLNQKTALFAKGEDIKTMQHQMQANVKNVLAILLFQTVVEQMVMYKCTMLRVIAPIANQDSSVNLVIAIVEFAKQENSLSNPTQQQLVNYVILVAINQMLVKMNVKIAKLDLINQKVGLLIAYHACLERSKN